MKNIVLIALALTSLYGCVKDKRSHPVGKELNEAFNYQKGTYWIYKDSISGRMDSLFVTGNAANEAWTTPHNAREQVRWNEVTISLLQFSIYPVLGVDTQYSQYSLEVSDLNMFGMHPFINYPVQRPVVHTAVSGTNTGSGTLGGVYDNYNNGARVFATAYEIMYGTNTYYLAPDAGIVKMRVTNLKDSSYRVWELQRWKLVK